MKPKRLTQTCAAILLGLSWISSPAQTPSERDILVDFYEATNGDDWYKNRNWLSADDHCGWFGITCEDNSVTGIQLPRNNLQGALGTDLFDLANLRDLDLSRNHLDGELPGIVINDLPQFDSESQNSGVSIDLSHNNLSGDLPEFTRGQGPVEFTLRLAANQLTGPIPQSWVNMELWTLDLGDNPLDMPLSEAWRRLPTVGRLELAGAGLTGAFPDSVARFEGDSALADQLSRIDLSRNRLEGNLPAWLSDLALQRLNLQHNELTGSIGVAIGSLDQTVSAILDLSHNQFSGEMPESLTSLELAQLDALYPGGSFPPALDLCWNDFDMPSGALLGFINDRHHGGAFALCQRTRKVVNSTISGSWYDPARPGEGLVQHVLDNGQVLLFWFTFPIRSVGTQTGQQAWFLSVTSPLERSLWLPRLIQPFGEFGSGNNGYGASPFWLSIDPLNGNAQQISYSRNFVADRSLGGIPSLSLMSDRQRQTPLTRLAGTACDNQQPHQWISGAWYDPERAGEGFVVDVNEDGRVVIYWFTYTPGERNRQAWMIGTGDFNDGRVIVDEMIQPVGTRFGEDFDTAEIEHIDWGRLTMTFDDDESGQISYDSHLSEYGSGAYPIERLARPMLADCSQGDER
jgi:hypothetical protein